MPSRCSRAERSRSATERYFGRYVQKVSPRVFLACGTELFAVVDPANQSLVAHDRRGVAAFEAADRFSHEAFPHLDFAVAEIFRRPPRRQGPGSYQITSPIWLFDASTNQMPLSGPTVME